MSEFAPITIFLLSIVVPIMISKYLSAFADRDKYRTILKEKEETIKYLNNKLDEEYKRESSYIKELYLKIDKLQKRLNGYYNLK